MAQFGCEGDVVGLEAELFAAPGHLRLGPRDRRALHDLASLLQASPEILLLRIEVRPGQRVQRGASRIKLREQAQARADTLFKYLWRWGKVAPDRLEATGYGPGEDDLRRFERAFGQGGGAECPRSWCVRLRAVQLAGRGQGQPRVQ